MLDGGEADNVGVGGLDIHQHLQATLLCRVKGIGKYLFTFLLILTFLAFLLVSSEHTFLFVHHGKKKFKDTEMKLIYYRFNQQC